jgi:hypothetical protein
MKKVILFITTCVVTFSVFSQTGNVGVGTNSPVEKLHIAGGNVLIEDGILARTSTGAKKDLLPIAIATISATGVVTDGTANVTCTKDGNDFIVDIGEKNNNCQTFISLLPGTAVRYNVFKLTGANDTKFRIELFSAANVQVNANFSMLVFKAGNDPLREYNITIATNMNGVRIAHGFQGIDAFGVDSITINITILAGVIVGGLDPETAPGGYSAAINIADIPCPAKITINNFGQIVGRGGRGGRGGGTYMSNTPNTNACIPEPGAGQPGGDAIYTQKKVTVNNQGYMAGGGGGGGGGKALGTPGTNGGGGGTGAGWPLVAGGQGGSNLYSGDPLDNCPPGGQLSGCLSASSCCCGGYAPFGINGNGNTHPSGTIYVAGSGGAGINGGFQGFFGGGIALPGGSNANTGPGGAAGKVIRGSGNGVGNLVINTGGGSYAGIVD